MGEGPDAARRRVAAVLRAEKNHVIERWLEMAGADPTLPAQGGVPRLVLRNNLDDLVVRLIGALESPGALEGTVGARGRRMGLASDAREHAAGRIKQGYSLAQVLTELCHFRVAVMDICRENGVELAGDEALFIHIALDTSAALVAVEMERAGLEVLRQDAVFRERLLGIVSHDLRNPINAIVGSAALMLRRDELDARQTKALMRIVSSGQRTLRMVSDLLDFTQARLGGGIPIHRARLDLHEFTRQVVEEVRAAHPNRAVLESSVGDGAGDWDPDRIAQLVTNLVSNALDYSPPESAVRVGTDGRGAEVVLSVENLGEPIAPELLGEIFEPMRRAAKAKTGSGDGGVGLGLYIVREIVRAHGGTVTVTSSAAAGTRFEVRLPRAEPAASSDRGAEGDLTH